MSRPGRGGFFLPSASASFSAPSTSRRPLGSSRDDADAEEELLVPRRLTGKQEGRLMAHLEDRFAEIGRGWNKRNQPTSTLPDLGTYLAAWIPVLSVITSIPSAGPSAALQISYLLRATTDILEGVQGYSLTSSPDQAGPTPDANVGEASAAELLEVLKMLDLLDRCWSVLLKGQAIDFSACRHNAARAMTLARIRSSASRPVLLDELERRTNAGAETPLLYRSRKRGADGTTAGEGKGVQEAEEDGPPRPNGRHVFNSKGYRTVGATERVRLRNVVLEGKERCFEWMRDVCHRPAPPRAAEEEERETGMGETIGGQGDLEMKGAGMEEGRDVDGIVTGDEESEDGGAEEEDSDGPKRKRQRVRVAEEPQNDEEEGLDMEEVPLDGDEDGQEGKGPVEEPGIKQEPQEAADHAGGHTDEARHFQELFASKFDPDEDDSSDEGRGDVGEAKNGEEELTDDASLEERDEEEAADVKPPADSSAHPRASTIGIHPSEASLLFGVASDDEEAVEEADNHTPSSTLAYDLDVQFARLFARTLGMLAEVEEWGRRVLDGGEERGRSGVGEGDGAE